MLSITTPNTSPNQKNSTLNASALKTGRTSIPTPTCRSVLDLETALALASPWWNWKPSFTTCCWISDLSELRKPTFRSNMKMCRLQWNQQMEFGWRWNRETLKAFNLLALKIFWLTFFLNFSFHFIIHDKIFPVKNREIKFTSGFTYEKYLVLIFLGV